MDTELRARKPQARRWLLAASGSAAICAAWFAYVNRDGCWFFWNGAVGVAIFVVPWLWLVVFFGLRLFGKIGLLVVSVVVLAVTMPSFDYWPRSAAESSAIGTLRQLQRSLQEAKSAAGYPSALPQEHLNSHWADFYRFEYRPQLSSNGRIEHYLIEATPIERHRCGPRISFTVDDGGGIHRTENPRAATLMDPLVE
jgi:hypothetical protein